MGNLPKSTYALIGYSCGVGAISSGAHKGPTALRNLNIVNVIESLGHTVIDLGDVTATMDDNEARILLSKASDAEKTTRDLPLVFSACCELSNLTTTALEQGAIPIIMGGDHSLSIGSVAAVSNFYRKKGHKIGLIWVDTHPDLNTPDTSPSMRIFGMSAAVLVGYFSAGLLTSLQNNPPALDSSNLSYIGLRDIDPGEQARLTKDNISHFTMKDIETKGLKSVIEHSIEVATKDTCGFVVSFDLDVCDPEIAPGTGTPISGGLTMEQAHDLVQKLYKTNKMLSFELLELNPSLDRNNMTAKLGLSLICAAVGEKSVQNRATVY